MTLDDFKRWLARYGEAWIAGDPDAVTELFSAAAAYYETPFDAPMMGTQAIHRYWTEGAKDGQRDVTFAARPLHWDRGAGYAKWQASFRRVPSGSFVELDGVLQAKFDDAQRCTEFREWWHRREK